MLTRIFALANRLFRSKLAIEQIVYRAIFPTNQSVPIRFHLWLNMADHSPLARSAVRCKFAARKLRKGKL